MEGIKTVDTGTGTTGDYLKSTTGALNVADVAVHPGEDATFDRTWGGALATHSGSISTGNVKASAGKFYGFTVSTAGQIEVKDGTQVLVSSANYAIGAGVSWAFAVSCTTNISVSASAAVCTVFYL